jgi:PAS domain S-box-containing protein
MITARMKAVAQREEPPKEFEYDILRKDGSIRTLSASTIHLELQGEIYTQTTFQDITERKRAEEALIESEGKLKTLFEILPVGAAILDAERNIVYVNPALERILGVPKEGLFKGDHRTRTYLRRDGTLMPPEELASVRAIKEQRAVHNVETGVVKEDGTVVWTAVSAVPVGFPDWNVVVVTSDITERMRAEEALRESEMRFRSVWENNTVGMRITNEEGIVLLANDKYCRLMEKAHDEIEGKPMCVVYEETRHAEILRKHQERFRARSIPDSLERDITLHNGKKLSLQLSNTFLRTANQAALSLSVFRDDTERKRMDESLKKERATLSTMIEAIPDEICFKDAESRYVMANAAAVKALGAKSLKEMIGKTDLDFVRPEMALRHLAEEKAILESGEPAISRERIRLDPRTGEIEKCDLSTKVPVKDRDGNAIGLLVINRDITDRKLTEQRLRMTGERLRELAAHVQTVREEERKHLAQEFHDQIGQTLTALKMDLTMLQYQVADRKKELSRTAIDVEIQAIQQMADHAIGSIREIMAELRPEVLDHLGILPALEFEVEKFQRNSGISCVFTSHIEEIELDQGKSIALFRIFQEAITNVARHAQATHVHVITRREGDDLILEIKDDGIGISFDAENKTRSFGLIGMRERAMLFGGKVEITGTMGKGTTIVVRMPLYQTLPDGGG